MKVYFAGLDNAFWRTLAQVSGANYGLTSAYLPLKKINSSKDKVLEEGKRAALQFNNNFQSIILDSGLFSLMFGRDANEHKSERDYIEWNDNYINYINSTGYKGIVVECDVQKVLGVEQSWHFRHKLASNINNDIINVFHVDDGQKGLDRLIEYSNYIAVSIPEMRALGKKSKVVKVVNYIKNAKPSIKIHLLGCTEKVLLQQLNFCTSCDSTSWQQVLQYGSHKYYVNGKSQSLQASQFNFDKESKEIKDKIINLCHSTYSNPTQKTYNCAYRGYRSIQILKGMYEELTKTPQ